jgi:hypothetical protein
MTTASLSHKLGLFTGIFSDRKRLVVMLSDFVIIIVSYVGAFLIPFEIQVPESISPR